MKELIAMNTLALSSLHAYLLDWMNVLSSLCVYTTTQTTKFSESHLQVVGWYLDCFARFVPVEEKPLFASLVNSAPEDNIVPFEEPDIVKIPLLRLRHRVKRVEQRRLPLKPSSQVVTWSGSKPPFEPPTFFPQSIYRSLSVSISYPL